ncbi:MAG: universal stress protein, partial [Gammaproteobacteria bacterium]
FGDLGTGLMRNCPCPVWVVRPEQTVPCTRILAAVGGDDGDPRCEAMNGCIVGLGAALARSHDAELHIVHAWSPRGKDAELLTNEIADETREHVLRRNEAACRSAINRLLSETPVAGLDHQIHLPRGLPQREIVSLAGRLAVDVVVMGGTWRTGIPRLLMGNPAETVFGTIGCSVLTLKAEGIEALQPGKPDVDLPSAPLRAVGAR